MPSQLVKVISFRAELLSFPGGEFKARFQLRVFPLLRTLSSRESTGKTSVRHRCGHRSGNVVYPGCTVIAFFWEIPGDLVRTNHSEDVKLLHGIFWGRGCY